MQTEIEKFDQINRYLKGQLSEEVRIQFEAEISADAQLKSQVEMHRLLNETIVDNYLIDVKQKAKQVFKQKKIQQNKKNWTIGLGSIILVGTIFVAYNQFKENNATEQISLTNQLSPTIKPNEVQLNQTTIQPKAAQIGNLSLIKEPTKPNSTTKEIVSQTKDEPAFIPVQVSEVRSDLNAKPVVNESHSQKEKVLIEKKPAVDEKPVSAPMQKEEIPEKRQDVQLILNISRNETVVFPVEDGFAGEIEIMNENGTKIWHSSILNGQPNTWDGLSILGGQVTSGQYVFLLKDVEGNVRNQGFITVVR